ncbi:MAG TPA: ribbon-helix-helix domain-containing protein [Steroidobacteraceae bacterium]|nr:ribbon-helix-helix domain-containing protein [Steroidobacteraceae bacterium]
MATMKGSRETTSIYLRPGVLDALRKLSEETDTPVAHYLRLAVDDLLAKHGIEVQKKPEKAPRAKRTRHGNR